MTPVLLPTTLTAAGTASLGETILFGVVAAVTVMCGIGVLTARRAVYAAVNMILIMISLAVLYVTNEAPFLGITQVVVYTGAVMMLVLFVIMLVGVGGEESIVETHRGQTAVVGVLGLGLAAVLVTAVLRSDLGAAVGLTGVNDTAAANPGSLADLLFSSHVVAMELTAILLVTAAVGALTLTHRDRLRPRRTQRVQAEEKMRAYAEHGTHPGQRAFPGVYAATNSAAAPALAAGTEVLDDSVPRVLRVRGQELELSDVAPGLASASRAGELDAVVRTSVARSGMASMPGAAAPAVVQPVAPPPTGPDGSTQGAENKEEEK